MTSVTSSSPLGQWHIVYSEAQLAVVETFNHYSAALS